MLPIVSCRNLASCCQSCRTTAVRSRPRLADTARPARSRTRSNSSGHEGSGSKTRAPPQQYPRLPAPSNDRAELCPAKTLAHEVVHVVPPGILLLVRASAPACSRRGCVFRHGARTITVALGPELPQIPTVHIPPRGPSSFVPGPEDHYSRILASCCQSCRVVIWRRVANRVVLQQWMYKNEQRRCQTCTEKPPP